MNQQKPTLDAVLIVDCSHSLGGAGLSSLNYSVKSLVSAMAAMSRRTGTNLQLGVIRFGDHAGWHVPPATPVEQFRWTDLQLQGLSRFGEALRLVNLETATRWPYRPLVPPVVVLLSDGRFTDEWLLELDVLRQTPWGQAAIRTSVRVGQDSNDMALRCFSSPYVPVMDADNPDALLGYIRWPNSPADEPRL